MKVLVTGHRGFIGSHVIERFNALNIPWVGYDLVDGDDIRDKVKLDIVIEKNQIDTVIHLAALAGVRRGEDYPQEYFDTNVIGTDNLLRISKKFGVKKFIALSSSSVNGGNPTSVYGTSKLAMEHLIKRAELPYKFIVRPFTVYGERGRKDQVIFKWVEQYQQGKQLTFYGDGQSFRTYVYAGDLADALIMMLSYEPEKSDVTFELGGGEKVTLNKVKQVFLSKYPAAFFDYQPFPKCDSYGIEPNLEEATKMGWAPKTNFEEKMKEII